MTPLMWDKTSFVTVKMRHERNIRLLYASINGSDVGCSSGDECQTAFAPIKSNLTHLNKANTGCPS